MSARGTTSLPAYVTVSSYKSLEITWSGGTLHPHDLLFSGKIAFCNRHISLSFSFFRKDD